MTTVETRPDGDTVVRNDRSHVFHSWSAQGLINPHARRRWRGGLVLGLRGPTLPRLLLPARQPQHRPPAPSADRRHPGGGRPLVHRGSLVRQRRPGRGRPPDRRAGPRRPGHGVLHQWRRRGDRERHPHGPPAHRPAQGADHVPQLPRLHCGRDHHDRRPRRWPNEPAAVGHGQVLGPVPVPLRLPRRQRGRGVRAGPPAPGRRHHGRGRPHHRRHRSWRRSSAPTASSSRRPAT